VENIAKIINFSKILAKWLKKNNLGKIILSYNVHQPVLLKITFLFCLVLSTRKKENIPPNS